MSTGIVLYKTCAGCGKREEMPPPNLVTAWLCDDCVNRQIKGRVSPAAADSHQPCEDRIPTIFEMMTDEQLALNLALIPGIVPRHNLTDYIVALRKQAHEYERSLINCLLLARREKRRSGIEARTIAAWTHVIRFCEEAGIQSSGILRTDTEQGSPDGEAPQAEK